MSNVPDDLKYTEEHEWVRTEADGTLTVGLTDRGQQMLGDIVYVTMPADGKVAGEGDPVCVVESVKAAADIFAPVAGKVIAANQELADSPEEINMDPYDAWIFRMKPDAGASTANLLDAAAYRRLIEE